MPEWECAREIILEILGAFREVAFDTELFGGDHICRGWLPFKKGQSAFDPSERKIFCSNEMIITMQILCHENGFG